jgi:hypothetical protein
MALAPGWYWQHLIERDGLERLWARLAGHGPARIGVDLSKTPDRSATVELVITPAGRFEFHDAFLASPFTEGEENAKKAKETAG